MPRSMPLFVQLLATYVLFNLASKVSIVTAQPTTVLFDNCPPTSATEGNPNKRLNITTVYAQIAHWNASSDPTLKMTLLGETGDVLQGFSNTTGYLATLFTSTTFLNFGVHETQTSLCDAIRPPSPLPQLKENVTTYCPLQAGRFAIGVSIPLDGQYVLNTIVTRVRIVDSSSPAHELACLDAYTTRLQPTDTGGLYGDWNILFWATIGLTAGYWVVTGIARISAAWNRGHGRSGNAVWFSIERLGFVLASAISGEKFASSPALLRFSTPSARDILLQTQWCATLAMVAVQWPQSIYPILSNTAWSTLAFNVSLIQGDDPISKRWDPLQANFTSPLGFSDQSGNSTSPLYMDINAPNELLMFPDGASSGMPKFAAAVGLRPQDLFGTCLVLFLMIVGASIAITAVVTVIDWLGTTFCGSASHGYSTDRKDAADVDVRRPWWKFRMGRNSFHGSTLHGNLVRLLILFHFPITTYSCYQLTLDSSIASITSKVLAALSFALLSVLIPSWLLFRVATTSTSKLYDATRTLLALGPLYNEYQHESQLFAGMMFVANLCLGIVVGCGQQSGTAQAIIILVVEVVVTLSTSIWLPWMHGAQMGVISFIFCVARIIAAVLMVILARPVDIGNQAGGWIAYTVLVIQGIVFAAFGLMLMIKLLEGIVRIIRRQPFSGSRQSLDSGLLGAMGCCVSSKRNKRRRPGAPRSRRKPRPTSNYSGSTARSHGANGQILSSTEGYLKPDQTSTRYKEDSEEESGVIMSSWKPDHNAETFMGYTTQQPGGEYGRSRPSKVGMSPSIGGNKPIDQSNPPTSGFTRLGGGRAHHETPYAIVQGRKALQPGRSASTPAPPSLQPSAMDQTAPLPTPIPHLELASISTPQLSTTTAPPHSIDNPPLPREARTPFPLHGRTRSQTAIVENASALAVGSTSGRATSPKPSSRPPSAGKSRPPSAGRPGSAGRPHSAGKSRPPSAGKSRPPSAGKGRPGSSGTNKPSRPPSSGQVPRPPSYIEVPSAYATEVNDQGVLVPVSAGPSSSGRSRGWFGILGGKDGDSSDEDDDQADDEDSKASVARRGSKRGGLWAFTRKRRKSEGDMSATPSPGVATESQSFVVLRGNSRPSYEALIQAAAVDRHGSIVESRSLGAVADKGLAQGSQAVLIPRTPISPDEDGMLVHVGSPPSSYNPPNQARRMSNPTM